MFYVNRNKKAGACDLFAESAQAPRDLLALGQVIAGFFFAVVHRKSGFLATAVSAHG